MTSLSSSVFPYSPTKEGHCLPLTCILLEIIILTSMAFQIVDRFSAQKSILIFLCFSVACKGHKYRTDYLRKKKNNKIFALLFCCILLGNTKLFSHSSQVMCIFWCPIPPLWWAWKESMVLLQYLMQVHLCISSLCKPQAQESLGNAYNRAIEIMYIIIIKMLTVMRNLLQNWKFEVKVRNYISSIFLED